MQKITRFHFPYAGSNQIRFGGCDLSHKAKRYGTPSDNYKLARNPQLNPKVFIDKNFRVKNFDHSYPFLSLKAAFVVF